MTNRINPEEAATINEFNSQIDDADRFKDISLFIYQQNRSLYKRYFRNLSNETLDKLALCSDSINDLTRLSKSQYSIDKIKHSKKFYSDSRLNSNNNKSVAVPKQTVTRICTIL